ncbi:MAG: hypothetical protein QM697_17655 [Lachnospiraceae bacterium]
MSFIPERKKQCANCGANYSYQAAKCPYCGTVNEIGAEREYMGHLEDIRKDLEDIAEFPENAYKEEIKTTGHKIYKPVLWASIILAISILVFWYINKQSSIVYSKEQLLWEQETYPKLDRWYEEGEYDKIQELFLNAEEYSVYGWKHYNFIISYGQFESVLFYLEAIQNGGKLSKADKEFASYDSLCLIHEGTYRDSYKEFTDEEKVLIEEYGESAKQLLIEGLGLDEQQIEDLYQAVSKNGYVDYNKCCEYIEEIE